MYYTSSNIVIVIHCILKVTCPLLYIMRYEQISLIVGTVM